MSRKQVTFRKSTRGATAIEYGLLAALVALGLIAGGGTLGQTLEDEYDSLGSCVTDPIANVTDC